MPNWCTNRLVVIANEGDATALDEFVKSVTVSPDVYDLTLPHPTPHVLLGTRSPMQTRESVEEMRADRDAGKLRAGDNFDGETQNGSWVTDEYLAGMIEQIEQGEKAHEETGYNNWYDWNIAKWGTKWAPDVHDILIDVSDDVSSATVSYQTAWGPAEGLVSKLSELNPLLSFVESYLEEGMDFWGANAYKDGEVRHSYYGDEDPVLGTLHTQYHEAAEIEDDGTAEMETLEAITERWQELMDRAETDALNVISVLT